MTDTNAITWYLLLLYHIQLCKTREMSISFLRQFFDNNIRTLINRLSKIGKLIGLCLQYHPIINRSLANQKRKDVLKIKNQRSFCTCTLNMVFDNAFQKPSTD